MNNETIEFLLLEICEVYKVNLQQLRSKSRKQKLVKARIALINLFHANGIRPTAIARVLNRDHSTVCFHLGKEE